MNPSKKVLVCPLDWGLGHATRCIPVIRELQRQGAEVLIASSGQSLDLLKLEFPGHRFFELPSYRPVYSSGNLMALKMLLQIPRFLSVVKEEHTIIEKWIEMMKIDLIISDNRFGCWSTQVRSVFITHQVRLLMPMYFGWTSPFVNFFIGRYHGKFTDLWIPDQPGSGLTDVFNPKHKADGINVGWLSRFTKSPYTGKKYEIIAIVSGPEPQRALFEKLLLDQLTASGKKSLLVAGEPGNFFRKQAGCVEMVNHLPASALEEAIASAELVISRSGYSTVMDLIALGKKAIFVPTPQQPEQIFLADHLMKNRIAFAVNQRNFSLPEALARTHQFQGLSFYTMEPGYLSAAVKSVLT